MIVHHFSRNLVVALRELSIRGDFHSTGKKPRKSKIGNCRIFFFVVEILIRLFERDDYINNTVETSWLDGLIAEHFQTEKPNILLSIVCGAIHIADETFRTSFQNFQSSLER